MTSERHPRRRGLTLTELIVTLGIMTLVMLGMGSAIMLARHALPDDERTGTQILGSIAGVRDLMEEIRMAVYVSEQTATAISFNVHDRDGDGYYERIRYAWSGTPGDPLTRTYNDETSTNVLESVQELSFTYDTESVTETYQGAPVWSTEQRLAYYIDEVNNQEFTQTALNWTGQYFEPDSMLFSGDALAWRVSRARFVGRKTGLNTGEMRVQIRSTQSSLPTNTVLAEKTFYESFMNDTLNWYDVNFVNSKSLQPGSGAALVFKHWSNSPTAILRHDTDGPDGRLLSITGGSLWTKQTEDSLHYEIYGQISSPGPDQTATRHYLTDVGLALRTGSDSATTLSPSTQLPNRPEILSAFWEADFDVVPTAADRNVDGENDWETSDGLPFVALSLNDGTMAGLQGLLTTPDHDFNELITIDCRMRATTIGYPLTSISIYADWTGDDAVLLQFVSMKQADGTQNLLLVNSHGGYSHTLMEKTGLSQDLFDVRLIIDPGIDTVAVFINDEHEATEYYTRKTIIPNLKTCHVSPGGNTGEFDFISIRVGGEGSS